MRTSWLCFVPLGVPLIAGPAVLTTEILLANEHGAFVTALALLVNVGITGGLFSRLTCRDGTDLLDPECWGARWTGERWQEELSARDDAAVVQMLRSATRRGRPLGSDRFLSKVEKVLGRRVRPLPVGRPRTRGKRNARKR